MKKASKANAILVLCLYLPSSLVLSSYLTMRSLRRRVHFAHFSVFLRQYSTAQLSAVSSRDIFVDALYSPSVHRIVVVRYSLRICSQSHTRESIRVACFTLRSVLNLVKKDSLFSFSSKILLEIHPHE